MPRIIKLTKQQLKETDNGDFDYIDDENDMPSRIGQSQISVVGKVEDTESVDVNNDNVDDFYNNDELDILSNGDNNDNLIQIPQGVDYKTNMLVDAMNNLNSKQQAIVINKILENVNMNDIPYRWKKELIMKLLSNNKIK